jgi:hypothetical protein
MARWRKVPAEKKLALAARLRAALARRKGVTEKGMFGGVCFLLRGNMLCGTGSGDFMFRVGKDAHAAALKRPGARAMRMNGRLMRGFIWVDPRKCDAKRLKSWLALAASHVATLPRKSR